MQLCAARMQICQNRSLLSDDIVHHHGLLVLWTLKTLQRLLQEVEDRGAVGTFASMQFIDFEYGGYAYRGHDWGNHFAEYAGFECEYSRYPNNEHVELFVRAYLNEGSSKPAVRALSFKLSSP